MLAPLCAVLAQHPPGGDTVGDTVAPVHAAVEQTVYSAPATVTAQTVGADGLEVCFYDFADVHGVILLKLTAHTHGFTLQPKPRLS